MASIGFDNLIRVSVNANAYLGDSYDAARKSGDVGFAFLFDVLAVVGEGIWLNGSISTDPIPFPDSNPLAYLTYDLDKSFSVALTAEGRESVEQDVGSGYKLNIDYVMMYLADSPDVPAFAFGPNAFESAPPGAYALREGYMTEATGNQSHAEGYSTTASGDAAHSEGRGTVATGDWSHAEGQGTEAVSTYAHAEGYSTHARSTASHAEGYRSNAGGQYAHAEGYSSTASNTAAHAEGWGTTASKAYSHAQNLGTKAASDSQTALGKYNVEDANGDYALIVGNGTSDSARSNALTVGWDGSVETAGDVTVDGTLDVSFGALLRDDVDVGGDLIAVGDVAAGGALNVTGNATVDGTLDVGFGTTLRGNLNMELHEGNATHLLLHDARMDRSHGGVPTTGAQVERCIGIQDKDGNWVGRLTFRQEASGLKRTLLEAVGANSSGTSVWNSISVAVSKDGVRSYSVSDPAAFCTTLHVGDRVTDEQSTNLSIANAAWKNVCSLSLAAGTWVIEANVQFTSNATGRRYIALSETSNAASAGVQRQTCMNSDAVNGASTFLHTGATKAYTAATTLYLVAYQNSGAALNVQGLITAVRIK